jgi:hypothetical protein
MTATASGSAAPHGAATEEELGAGPGRNRLSWNATQVFLQARAPFFTFLPDSRGHEAGKTYVDTLIKKKRKFSSYKRKFRGIGCKVMYD